MFSVNGVTSYACSGGGGGSRTCPQAFEKRGALCVSTDDFDGSYFGYTFSGAADFCNQMGAHLPSSAEMRAIMKVSTEIGNHNTFGSDWIDAQVADGIALWVANFWDAEHPEGEVATDDWRPYARCVTRIE